MTSSLPFLLHLNLGPELLDGFVDVSLRVLGDAQNGLTTREAVSADGADQPSTSSAVALFELLSEHDFARRREEDQGAHSPNEGVEVDAAPSSKRLGKAQD